MGLCAATCLGPLGRGLATEHYTSPGEKAGALGFSAQYHCPASLWVCSSLGRMRLSLTSPRSAPGLASEALVGRGVGVSARLPVGVC